MIAITTNPQTYPKAAEVVYPTADEAYQLMSTEVERLIRLVEGLDPQDWSQPTACSEWNVRDILAHQAGGFAGGTGYREMIRQVRNQPEPGQLMEDAINAFQVQERADKSPQELMEELRRVGPVAAKKWAYHFRAVRWISLPHRDAGKLSIRHLNWVIHSRDTWMHRLDICRATGRQFEQSREHDSRIAELVMLDVAENLRRKYDGPALLFELTGLAGGSWVIGEGEPAATITMDVLEFNIFASGRDSFEVARPKMSIAGDIANAEKALRRILVVY